MDLNGFNLGAVSLSVSGSGINGAGAIISTAATPQTNALQTLTFSGNTTIGGSARWDLRGATNPPAFATLSTAGNPYNLTKTGGNQISLAAVNLDSALSNIDIQQGVLGLESSTTSLGNPADTLTVELGATLSFLQTTTPWNKIFFAERRRRHHHGQLRRRHQHRDRSDDAEQ